MFPKCSSLLVDGSPFVVGDVRFYIRLSFKVYTPLDEFLCAEVFSLALKRPIRLICYVRGRSFNVDFVHRLLSSKGGSGFFYKGQGSFFRLYLDEGLATPLWGLYILHDRVLFVMLLRWFLRLQVFLINIACFLTGVRWVFFRLSSSEDMFQVIVRVVVLIQIFFWVVRVPYEDRVGIFHVNRIRVLYMVRCRFMTLKASDRVYQTSDIVHPMAMVSFFPPIYQDFSSRITNRTISLCVLRFRSNGFNRYQYGISIRCRIFRTFPNKSFFQVASSRKRANNFFVGRSFIRRTIFTRRMALIKSVGGSNIINGARFIRYFRRFTSIIICNNSTARVITSRFLVGYAPNNNPLRSINIRE